MTTLSIGAALKLGLQRLQASSSSPQLDCDVLLCHALQCNRTTLLAWPERALSESQQQSYENLLKQRVSGIPVAYLLGEREFWSLPLRVSAEVLIPRPDTELLVETALQLLAQRQNPHIADLGTGSGAIALALAHERRDSRIVATDASAAALAVASANAQRLGLSQIRFSCGNWCEALTDGGFDLIVSNPPYIRPDDPHLQQGDLRFEPIDALRSADNGLADLRHIAACSRSKLKSASWLLLEHGYDQHNEVQSLLDELGYTEIETREDLGGQPRATLGRWT